ncbi:MAG: DUF1553 domain-containing protein [Acidobacteria bacterium]|nr:DUF1553 domain-containing protein [Acidobacteriota bacterium]
MSNMSMLRNIKLLVSLLVVVGVGAYSVDVSRADHPADPPTHWAFVPPVRAAQPVVKNEAWGRTPIDRFILAAIEKQGLTPSEEATRTTLIRRLSLDLTGLPPTIAEIDQFLNDRSPDAYQKLTERLLASPHYGERWGRWWLDAARYADTNGFEKDLPRSIWPYRDWVIKAFNRDLPFNQMTIDQLAGDLVATPTPDQLVATGFLRNSMRNEEGGVDPEQFRVEGLIDRVDAIGKSWLGLSVNCAQCHNHKYDPILQEEYYKFYAFLNQDDEPEVEIPEEKILRQRGEISGHIAKVEDELIAATPNLDQRLSDWESQMRPLEGNWSILKEGSIFASFGTKFDRLPDFSWIPKGDNSTKNVYVIQAKSPLQKITALRLELLTDATLPFNGPGRSPTGGLFLSEVMLEVGGQRLPFAEATADFSRVLYPIKNTIDGDTSTPWDIEAGPGLRNQDRKAVFVLRQPIEVGVGGSLTISLVQKQQDRINIGRFRLAVTDQPGPQADPLPSPVRRILSIPASARTTAQKREVFNAYRVTVAEWAVQNERIAELWRDWPYGSTTLALKRREEPRETRIFKRGDWKRPGEQVVAGTPAVLPGMAAGLPRNRLGLAQWIVDRGNPLTARVIVNRVWQQYFGVGLVTTPEDFGTRCEPPSHPELLDWLAVEFMESGWSIKHLHRLIVNSATYRQTSRTTPLLLEKDPTNRWLARMPRLRVESEIIRDIFLATSGLLSRKIGGPSVFPPIPDGVLVLSYGGATWNQSTGEDRYRRGMYTFWKRSVPYPGLLVFDMPNGDQSCPRRTRSNTPLQALTTLNDPVFMEAAQALALRIWKEGGATDRSKIIYGFRLCTGRQPSAFELQQLTRFLEQQRPGFVGRTASAVYVAAADPSQIPEDLNLEQVAPWTMVARILLNLDESITRE